MQVEPNAIKKWIDCTISGTDFSITQLQDYSYDFLVSLIPRQIHAFRREGDASAKAESEQLPKAFESATERNPSATGELVRLVEQGREETGIREVHRILWRSS